MGAALPFIAIAATLGGGAMQAAGQIQAGNAAKASANYNAAIARMNADQAKNNQQIASQTGMAQTGMQEQKTRAEFGQTLANQAGSGVDVNSGSFSDVQASERTLGDLDALTVRQNATKEAFGYKVQETNQRAQGELDKFEGKNAQTAGYIGAAGTLLGTAGSSSSQYQKYKMAGSL